MSEYTTEDLTMVMMHTSKVLTLINDRFENFRQVLLNLNTALEHMDNKLNTIQENIDIICYRNK